MARATAQVGADPRARVRPLRFARLRRTRRRRRWPRRRIRAGRTTPRRLRSSRGVVGSPVGRALLGARPGQLVRVELPDRRDRVLRILDVTPGRFGPEVALERDAEVVRGPRTHALVQTLLGSWEAWGVQMRMSRRCRGSGECSSRMPRRCCCRSVGRRRGRDLAMTAEGLRAWRLILTEPGCSTDIQFSSTLNPEAP
jgi:hypothetical protein